ncbi:MAG: tetratricopeptide repeat protein, partial [Thermogemmatispora sp.]|uniref:BTAD domain-containing putative transcriptional regulator n=1 Tax=Thermogemmatispora sp. TaxID=1968838 RepID=UPI002618283F
RSDLDPVVFLRTLLASLRQTFPAFGASLDALFRSILSAETASATTLYTSALTMLCTALATEVKGPFLLLLCNYEEVNESETVNALVNELLRRFPPQATLIIESRSLPDLSFPALIIREAIYGLDHEALRFSAEEIAELAALQGLPPLSEEEAASLAASFDGWIAGILLGTRIGDARMRLLLSRSSAADEKRGSSTALATQKRTILLTYLVNEVLKHAAQTQSFLQSISLLHHVYPSFCNALLDITDAHERLAHLERQGLFLFSHASGMGLFYTIHPVIRELLSEQLRHQEPERFRLLHRRAAELWHARHEDEEAMYHALESESYDLAVSFILATAENLLSSGQRETLIRWINMLPEASKEHHPRLLLLQATIALDYGQRTTALPLLDRAEALLAISQGPDTALLEATCAILRAKALFQVGDYRQAQLLCQKALLYLPEQERHLRASAQMRLGICHTLQGDLTGGVMHLQQALQLWPQQPPPTQSIEIHSALANTYYLLSNLVLARHHLTAMLNACEQLQDTPSKISARILQGLIAQDEGQIAEAEAIFLEVLSLARSSPYPHHGEAYALVNLAGIAVEQGNYARALAYAQEGLTLACTFGTRSVVNAARANLALSYLFLHDPTSALLIAEQMEVETADERTVGYERAWRDLTIGLIFLAQGRYAEAATCLRGIEAALYRTHLPRASLLAKLRLAVCYHLQRQPERAEHALAEVVSILHAQPTFAHLVQQEWRLLRTLMPELGKHPRFAALQAFLVSSHQTQVALPTDLQTPDRSPSTAVVISRESVLPSLTIYAFGEPVVLLNGQPIKHWRMARGMELFFFLLDARYPVSKETLLTALWPEYDECTARTFHNTLYYLRKILGEACILFTPAGYTLNLAAGYGDQVWYDVQLFEDQRLVAESALAEGQPDRAKAAFREMIQLYRGDYGRPFYREWCTRRRDELRTIYLEACRQLAQIAWREGAWGESAEYWRRMLLLDSCLEEAHYGLIRCYLRQGKRGAALRQYQTCQRTLQEELGVQPGQALQVLYQRLTST